MKKITFCCLLLLCVFSLSSCGTAISDKRYDEISTYVLENIDTLSPNEELEFFDYETTGTAIGGVYYGYYYTANNEVAVPDYYSGNNLGEQFEADDGTYFGKPNDGTDWCYIKPITGHWYYYELHWA